MLAVRSILCPVDFSEESRHALRWAGALARRAGNRLTIFAAVDPLLAQAATVRLGQDLVKTETEPALEQFVAATWSEAMGRPANTTLEVRVGEPADAILEAAARESADLIVMGTQGLGGVRKWLLGSTTERVLRAARTPVFAVPPTASAALPRFEAAAGDAGPVLAATDFSEAAAHALRWAADLAPHLTSRLLLLHVVEPVAVAPQWRGYTAEAEQARLATALERLRGLAAQAGESPGAEAIVVSGRTAETIASVADERGASVVVMGLASRQGPLSARPGAIAYRVLSLAKAAVLVVPPEPTGAHSRPM